jgi:thioredoxin 1
MSLEVYFVVLILLSFFNLLQCYQIFRKELASITRLHVTHKLVTAEDFEEATKMDSNRGVVVIDFKKNSCQPCKKVQPAFDNLSNKYSNVVNFFSVDADASSDCIKIMKRFGVKSVPTFFIYNHGERIDSVIGGRLDDLEALIKFELQKNGVEMNQLAAST